MMPLKKLRQRLRRNFHVPASGRRIIVIHPSGRHGSSGPYLQALAEALSAQGHAALMLGRHPDYLDENGVCWLPLGQRQGRLDARSRRIVQSFAPDVVLLVGIRCHAMLAALEITWERGIPLVAQAEDDDLLSFLHYYPGAKADLLDLLDAPKPSTAAVEAFIARIDWALTGRIWRGEEKYRLVEPVLRALVLHQANAFGAIWHPMADSLRQRFAKPCTIIPPVVVAPAIAAAAPDRSTVLRTHGIRPEHPVVFVSGTTYGYSEEFPLFLAALSKLRSRYDFTLVLTSKTHIPELHRLLAERLDSAVAYRVLDLASDADYEAMLAGCDIVAVPGVPDEFNRLRLPGRIPRAMMAGKPVFTFAAGFGASLNDGVNAVLTHGDSIEEWAQALAHLFDPAARARIGAAGRDFARTHFRPEHVAKQLVELLDAHAKAPLIIPDTLAPLAERLRQHLLPSV